MDDKIQPKHKAIIDESTWDRNAFSRSYVVLTALRGPDVLCPTGRLTKSIYTRRLRGIVFTHEECKGDYTTRPLSASELRPLEEYIAMTERVSSGGEYDTDLAHFYAHLFDAVMVTRHHPIWGDSMPYAARVLEHLMKASIPRRSSAYDYHRTVHGIPPLPFSPSPQGPPPGVTNV